MDVFNHLRSSFRNRLSAPSHISSSKTSDNPAASKNYVQADTNNNSNNSSTDTVQRKSGRSVCDLCGKRLFKLVRWRNYFRLPCKFGHVFCKQCITDRLQCRQKVMQPVSFDLMWTFPCPGSSQCGQQLTVDFSRGSSYSKNLVARDLCRGDDSWELEEEDEEDTDEELDLSNDTRDSQSGASVCDHSGSFLREIG